MHPPALRRACDAGEGARGGWVEELIVCVSCHAVRQFHVCLCRARGQVRD